MQAIASGPGIVSGGPYSPAIIAGDLIFISGQMPFDPASGELVGGGIVPQARQAFDNFRAVLAAAGATPSEVLQVSLFLVGIEDLPEANRLYAEFFSAPYPARTCVIVSGLPKGARIEIAAIARRPPGKGVQA